MKTSSLILIIIFTLITELDSQKLKKELNEKDPKLSHVIWAYQDNFEYFYYYDEYTGYFYDSLNIIQYNLNDTDNIWQVGKPDKGDWDDGYPQFYPDTFPPKVLVTDTINPYPVNNNSWSEVHIIKPSWTQLFNYCWSYMVISFRYKCDTDTLLDGLCINISFDGGLTFSDIFDTTAVKNAINGPDYHWPDMNIASLVSGNYMISGRSANDAYAGWTSFSSQSTWNNSNGFNVEYAIIRFIFKSDSIQNNKRGFIIDNLSVSVEDECNIIHINETEEDKKIVLYPNPVSKQSRLEFQNHSHNRITFEVYNSNGRLVYNDVTCKEYFEIGKTCFPRGIYLYKVYSDTEIIGTGKFIKN